MKSYFTSGSPMLYIQLKKSNSYNFAWEVFYYMQPWIDVADLAKLLYADNSYISRKKNIQTLVSNILSRFLLNII